MPHDAKGRLLTVGDHVLIPGTVTAIQATEEYCNCNVELDYRMPPKTDKDPKDSISAINTKQVVLDEKALSA